MLWRAITLLALAETGDALTLGWTKGARPTAFSHRRTFLRGLGIAVAVSGCPQTAFAAEERTIKLAGITYTPAAMILQMAEQTASMEGIMRQSAKEVEAKLTEQQRDERGANNLGPGVIGRGDMIGSIDVMIKNSQIASIPGGGEAASTLRAIQVVAKTGKGPLSGDEYELMAKQYAAAREDLRRAFEAMTPEAQAEGKVIVRGVAKQDAARMKQTNDDEEALRRLRAKIKAENEAAVAEPPRKKTLAELEAAQERFSKEQKQPVVSLYAR